MNSIPTRDFDDLAVGDRFASRGRTVTESDVASFAALTGDMHPQHTDAVWAARSQFGARVAHGMLVASYALGLLALDPERVVALRALRSAVFKRPVLIGDTIRAVARIESLTPVDAATGLAALRVEVVNQRGRVAARMAVELVWRRGGASQPGSAADEPLDLAGVPL